MNIHRIAVRNGQDLRPREFKQNASARMRQHKIWSRGAWEVVCWKHTRIVIDADAHFWLINEYGVAVEVTPSRKALYTIFDRFSPYFQKEFSHA
jgi:hypothetical protein